MNVTMTLYTIIMLRKSNQHNLLILEIIYFKLIL